MEEQREESGFVDDCRVPTEEEAGKGLDGDDVKTVEGLVDDENPNGRGLATEDSVNDEDKFDNGGESQGIEGEEESLVSSGEVDAEQTLVDGETLSITEIKAVEEKESTKSGEEDNNEMRVDREQEEEENAGANEEERTNVNQKEGEAKEAEYAVDASVVQSQEASIAEVDGNDANVVNEMEIDDAATAKNPNSCTEDVAATGEVEPVDHNLFDPSSDITNFIDFSGVSSWSGNIRDVKTETGNVSLKEDKKATHVAEDATVNAESNDNLSLNADSIELESPAAATREASDGVMGSGENQEDKETVDEQVETREEDDITHEAPKQEEDIEMEENLDHSDDGTDLEVKTNGVKRKADVLSEDSAGEGRKTVSLAKLSSAPTPSFKIGASIARAASQMAGTPSVLKGCKNLSVESFVSQLHRAATNPAKANVVSELAADFFVGFRNSTASQEVAPEKVTKKRGRPSKSNVGGTEAFEFEEMGDTYWTDWVIHNGGEEETPPTEKGNYQVVPVELKPAQVKKTRRPYRRRQSQLILPLPPASDKPAGFDENAPAELIMNFSETDTIPLEKSLSKMFRHFGPIRESQTEVDEEKNRARVVFRKGADADVAYNSAKSFNIFGTKAVNYELSFTITEAFKVQPYIVSLAEEDAALSLPS